MPKGSVRDIATGSIGLNFAELGLKQNRQSFQRIGGIGTTDRDQNPAPVGAHERHQIENAFAAHRTATFGDQNLGLVLIGDFDDLSSYTRVNSQLVGNNEFLFQEVVFLGMSFYSHSFLELQVPPSLSIWPG